jgi:signal transduction histidine kinase
MTTLLEELLQFSHLSKRDLQRAPVDLTTMAKEVADSIQRNDPKRTDVKVSVADGLTAEGDADMLRIVLENLIGNAWKFTAHRTSPTIAVGSRINDGKTEFFVQDDGAGFDMTYVHKLFTPFQRLHLQEEFPGTGVGLASVRRIIARHGGTVRAEGAVGKGTTISFTLPPRT